MNFGFNDENSEQNNSLEEENDFFDNNFFFADNNGENDFFFSEKINCEYSFYSKEKNSDQYYQLNDHVLENNYKDLDLKNKKEITKSNVKTNFTTNKIKSNKIFSIQKINKIEKINNENKKNKNNKILGRKRKDEETEETEGTHTKLAGDNLTRRIKAKFFEAILFFINSSFEDMHIKAGKKTYFSKNNILLKITKEIVENTNIKFNLELLNSQLKDIFSNNVSKKYSNYGLDYNRKLIQKIYEENIHIKAISILDRTLLECLEHFKNSRISSFSQ